MPFLPQYIFKQKGKRLFAFLFDLAGGIFFFIPSRFRARLDHFRIQKILVIRLDSLGDAVMMQPALKALRHRFPHAQIDLLLSGESAPLFAGSPEINEVLTMNSGWFSGSPLREQWRETLTLLERIKKTHYDLGIDSRGDLRNILLMFLAGIPERFGYGMTGGGFLLTHQGRYSRKTHQVLLNLQLLKPLGIEALQGSSPLTYSAARSLDFSNSTGRLLPENSKPRIVIHPGAGYSSKRWPAEKFKILIGKILEENLGNILLIGTEAEKKLLSLDTPNSRLIDLRGKTKLGELPILFDACHLFIGNDSGPSHIAAAQGIPMIVLFSGTNDASVWHPWSPSLELLQHPVPCSPCEARECPLHHHDCMQKIPVEGVLEKVRLALRSKFSGKPAATP